jgi:type II secretory pathway pseudopilin PulG
MLARHGFSIIELALIVVIIGIIATLSIPNYLAMQARAKEADVMAMAHAVQMAVEDYNVKSGGIYSDAEADIRPCLPYGLLLVNPFTGDRTEPQFAVPAALPGQVGIQVVLINGAPRSYTITGFGRSEMVITYTAGH